MCVNFFSSWFYCSCFRLDSLSIRRLRNWEGDRELRKRGIDPRTWKKERKEARLLFQAEIPLDQGNQPLKLSCKSRIFQCSSCELQCVARCMYINSDLAIAVQ